MRDGVICAVRGWVTVYVRDWLRMDEMVVLLGNSLGGCFCVEGC